MIDLQKYIDGLFRHQRLTPEVKDLKEEILSNMIAKRDDLIAQGLSAEKATEKAKESLSAIDYLIDGNQLTDSRFACSRRTASLRLGTQTSGRFALLGLYPLLRSTRAAHDGSDAGLTA